MGRQVCCAAISWEIAHRFTFDANPQTEYALGLWPGMCAEKMTSKDPFQDLAHELCEFTGTVVDHAALAAPDLRRILAFVAKVSHVLEQALRDVLAVLIEVKYLTPDDLGSKQVVTLRKEVDLLTVRSRYRDAEDQRSLKTLTVFAYDQTRSIRKALDDLRDLVNKILGLSGTAGLMELTTPRRRLHMPASLLLNKGQINMGDKYEVGQAGAVGRGAHAENVTFAQIWNKLSGDVDLGRLAGELEALRTALISKAVEPDHYIALGEIAAAEKASKTGDGPTALQHMAKAGKWVWNVANKIGIGVATAAAISQLGLK